MKQNSDAGTGVNDKGRGPRFGKLIHLTTEKILLRQISDVMVQSSPSQRQRNWGTGSKVLRTKGGRHEYRLTRTHPGSLLRRRGMFQRRFFHPHISAVGPVQIRVTVMDFVKRNTRVNDPSTGSSTRTNSLEVFPPPIRTHPQTRRLKRNDERHDHALGATDSPLETCGVKEKG